MRGLAEFAVARDARLPVGRVPLAAVVGSHDEDTIKFNRRVGDQQRFALQRLELVGVGILQLFQTLEELFAVGIGTESFQPFENR